MNTFQLLLWVMTQWGQEFSNHGLYFPLSQGAGHIEFYQYGPHMLAIVVKDSTGERQPLLTLDLREETPAHEVRLAAYLRMIRYIQAQLYPVGGVALTVRRIKD